MQNLAENLTRCSGSSILRESERLVIERFIYDREIWQVALEARCRRSPDIALANQLGRNVGQPLTMASATEEMLRGALYANLSEYDVSGM